MSAFDAIAGIGPRPVAPRPDASGVNGANDAVAPGGAAGAASERDAAARALPGAEVAEAFAFLFAQLLGSARPGAPTADSTPAPATAASPEGEAAPDDVDGTTEMDALSKALLDGGSAAALRGAAPIATVAANAASDGQPQASADAARDASRVTAMAASPGATAASPLDTMPSPRVRAASAAYAVRTRSAPASAAQGAAAADAVASTGAAGQAADCSPDAVTAGAADAVPTDASSEMVAATPTTPVASPVPPAELARLAGVSPELRQRLARVVERMRDEFGHDVEVVEGWRSQARQDALFAQGRTAPGPVVTWTRTSEHTHGRAVDVRIDGGWTNPEAFARLAAIAREEGLATLGPRDPGHLELPGDAAPDTMPARAVADLSRVRQDVPADPARVAVPATVARVAAVAQPAVVAAVARVAAPGTVGRMAAPSMRAAATGTAPAADATTTSSRAGTAARTEDALRADAAPSRVPMAMVAEPAHGPAPVARERGVGDVAADDRAAPTRAANSTDASVATPMPLRETSDTVHPTHATAAPSAATGAPASAADTPVVARADVAARIAALESARETLAAQPLRQLVLNVDGATTGVERVRLALRGTEVGAAFQAVDPVAASQLRGRLDELARALEGRGLAPEALTVQAARAVDPTDAARLLTMLPDADATRGVASLLHSSAGGSTRDRQDSPRTPYDPNLAREDGGQSRRQPRRDPRGDR